MADDMKDKAKDAWDDMGDKAHELKGRAKEKFEDMKDGDTTSNQEQQSDNW